MAKLLHGRLLPTVLIFYMTLSFVICTRNVGQLKEHCDTPTGPIILPPSIIWSRPDYNTEGIYYSKEAITGHRCFSLEVRLHRRYLTFHLSLRHHLDMDVCKELGVKRVELLGLAYYGDKLTERRERKPFGRVFRSNETRYNSSDFICDPLNK